MDSWWQLGEGGGFEGSQLSLFRITCPFCLERGNFELQYRATKRKSNSRKALNGDTYKCGNCAGFVMVLWSGSEFIGRDFHSYRVLPWPLKLDEHPEHWPEAVGRFWLQAHRSLAEENWDAAAVMTRSAMQVALRDHGGQGRSLRDEIDHLSGKGVLPPLMKDWAHELRELGNESAHPRPDQDPTQPADAEDIVRYLDFLLQYLYDLPHQIAEYQSRKS